MAYERIHPAVTVLYILSVTLPAVFSFHPILQIMGFTGAVLFLLLTEPELPKFRTVLLLTLLAVMVVLINPVFNHRGQTELFFVNNHAITLESVLYGVRNACCVLTVLLWCRIFNRAVSSEKLLAILARRMPKTALLLSSALRMVPLLRTRASAMRDTQKELGLYGNGETADRLSGGARVFSMLVTWSLDHASDVSSSMKARGYGLKGRTTYSVYRFRTCDAVLTAVILLMDAAVLTIMGLGKFGFDFYPSVVMERGLLTTTGFILYGVLACGAAALEALDALRWRRYRAGIQ